MRIGHQPDGRPAAVCMSSNSTPILTDERPPLGADGPLRRIENPCDLSTDWSREIITFVHKRMPHKSSETPQAFYAWISGAIDHGDEPLRISADAGLQRLIGSRYVPAQTAPQLDLFFDNPVVVLTNGIVRSLSARNVRETQRQLDRLYAVVDAERTCANLPMFPANPCGIPIRTSTWASTPAATARSTYCSESTASRMIYLQ